MKRLRAKLTYSNVMVTVLAVLVVGGGTAYAATEMLPKNSVGSKQIKKEAVTPAKLSKAAKATLTGPTGATGPQGPKGDKGEKGDTGATATALLAHVSDNGVLIGGSGVTKTERIEEGEYEVDFNRDVSGCNYQATLAEEEEPGSIMVEPRSGEVDGVYVETVDLNGGFSNLPFYLAVFCP